MALTVKKVERLKAIPGRYHDERGLYLQVASKTNASWLFRYEKTVRDEEGRPILKPSGRPKVKEHWLGLGSLHTFDLPEARERARDLRKVLADGGDPAVDRKAAKQAKIDEAAEARRAAARAITFKQAAESFYEAKSIEWKHPKHREQFTSSMERYVYPILGKLPVSAIDTPLVLKVLNQELGGKSFWLSIPETAQRTRRRIEWVLGWATVAGYRTGDNPARWRGHLDKTLSAPRKAKAVRHHPAIPWKQFPAFMAALKAREGGAARGLEFLALTAARTGEVLGARWSEIDLKAKLWTIPAERMKAGKVHRIPLSREAIDLLKELPRESEDPDAHVFPGAKAGEPLSNMTFKAVMKRMGYGAFAPHGLRSSFRDWAAHTNHSREAVELSLAHAVGSQVERSYFRDDLLAPRIGLMRDWAAFSCGPVPAEDDCEDEAAEVSHAVAV